MSSIIIRSMNGALCARIHQRIPKYHNLSSSASTCDCLQNSSNKTLCNSTDPDKMRGQTNLESARWSVVAYNLSEHLKIDHTKRFLENFSEYQISDIPNDLQKEAVMLSLRSDGTQSTPKPSSTPIHDVFLFREGSIVFWGVPCHQQKRILSGLSSLKINPYSDEIIQYEREHILYSLSKSSDKSKLTREVIQLASNKDCISMRLDQFTISHAIALSVKLGIWETKLDRYIASIESVTNQLKEGKSFGLTRSQVFRKTGEIYHLKHSINLSSELLDLPDVYWDRHDQEILFLSLTSFLNIKKRTAVINEKLNNCCELMNLLASHMNDKHHVRLELMIIALIMVEVCFEFVRLLF